MSGAFGTYGRKVLTRFWWRDPGERNGSEDIGVDNIKMHLQETGEDSADCIDMSEDREK
jgi:hypothetical protein